MTSEQPITLARAIEIAVEHHQARRLSEAEGVYRQVLNVDPDNFDALHLLGVVAHQSGRHAEAVKLISQALTRNPSSADALSNLGDAYRVLNDLEQARACFQKALSLKPDWADAHHNLGLTLKQLGAVPDAARAFHAAWVRDPLLFDAAIQCVGMTGEWASTAESKVVMPAMGFDQSSPSYVSIAFCSIDDTKHARAVALYRRLFAGLPHEIIAIRDARSLSEAYNRAVEQSIGDIIVLSHDDIDILASDFAARLQHHLRQFDAVGVIGATRMEGPGWAWSGHPHLRGWITHHAPDEETWFVDVVDPRSVADDIVVLDGVLLAGRRDVFIAVPFDGQTFDGFHLYDIDWSYRAAMAGFRLAAAGDLLLVHESRGRFDPAWERYAERFCGKHATGETGAAPHRQVFETALNDADQVRAFYARLAELQG